MKIFWMILAGAALVASSRLRAADPGAFSGQWKIDVAQSSSISPWVDDTLTIKAAAGEIEIGRALYWEEARKGSQVIRAKTDGHTVTSNPVPYWLDTWFNNAYISGDKTEKVTALWLEPGKVLKMETNLILNLQQGDHPVHIYEEYHLSPDGKTLRLYEIRSTRDQALTFVFTRQAAK